MYPILMIFLVLAIYVSRTNLSFFESAMVSEDGFFQWMTFYTLLFASLMSFYRSNILKPFRGNTFAFFLIASGIIFLVLALDEMSWLQRVFGFQSPQFFEQYNTSMKVNFHHLVLYGFHFNNLIFTIGIKILGTIYFLVLPYLYKKVEKFKNFVNRFAIPLPRYTQTGSYVVLVLLVGLIPSDLRYVIFEFGFYWIFALMMYNPLNDEIFSRISLIR
jgi:hypothetical protein